MGNWYSWKDLEILESGGRCDLRSKPFTTKTTSGFVVVVKG